MNLMTKLLLLAMSIFAIGQNATSTTEQVTQEVNSSSEGLEPLLMAPKMKVRPKIIRTSFARNYYKTSKIGVSADRMYHSYGEEVTIQCRLSTRNLLGIDWYRDNEACTSVSTWCHQENTTIDEAEDYSSTLHLFHLSANHSYTCVARMGDLEMKASVLIRVGAKPEILQLAAIPEEPQAKGRQVQVVCQFRSMTPPISQRIEEQEVEKESMDAPLTNLTDPEYRINLTFNPVLKQRLIICRVSNLYGSAERNITVQVDDRHLQEECISDQDCVTPNAICNEKSCQCPALLPVAINRTIPNRCLQVLEFGQRCQKSEQCYAADNHTLCDAGKGRCLCLPGYSKAKDKCILTPEGKLVVLIAVGLSLLLMIGSMLGLYCYRKRKETKELLKNNDDSDNTSETETKGRDGSKTVRFESAS